MKIEVTQKINGTHVPVTTFTNCSQDSSAFKTLDIFLDKYPSVSEIDATEQICITLTKT